MHVVNFCGGRGSTSIIKAICERKDWTLVNVVNAYDDGKSTGKIRRMFNMLGPSDLRKTQLVMATDLAVKAFMGYRLPKWAIDADDVIYCFSHLGQRRSDIFGLADLACLIHPFKLDMIVDALKAFCKSLRLYEKFYGERFDFRDCSIGNIIYAGMYEYLHCNFSAAVAAIGQMLDTVGVSITNSDQNLYLAALREDGEILTSEASIVEGRSTVRLRDFYMLGRPLTLSEYEDLSATDNYDAIAQYLRSISVMPTLKQDVKEAIKNADIIILSPGTQHSSIYPTLRTRFLGAILREAKYALRVMITNIGEDYETPGYTASGLVRGVVKQLRMSDYALWDYDYIDVALVNMVANLSEHKGMEKYIVDDLVKVDGLDPEMNMACIHADFEDKNNLGKHDGKLVIDTIERMVLDARK